MIANIKGRRIIVVTLIIVNILILGISIFFFYKTWEQTRPTVIIQFTDEMMNAQISHDIVMRNAVSAVSDYWHADDVSALYPPVLTFQSIFYVQIVSINEEQELATVLVSGATGEIISIFYYNSETQEY